MTVDTTGVTSGPYIGNGSTTVFPFSFSAGSAGEVQVLVDNVVQVSGFTVTPSAVTEGGSVTFAVAPAVGANILIASNPSFLQETSFKDSGQFLPSTHDEALDDAARRDLYLLNLMDRAIVAPLGESIATIADKTTRSGKFWVCDADGNITFTASNSGADTALRSDVAASGGSSLVGFLQSGGSARSVQAKLRDIQSLKDFGAAGDGATDDTAAVTAANGVAGRKYLPSGTYPTTLAATALGGPFWGAGQIKDSGGNKRGPYFTAVTSAPSSSGNFNDISTSFNGDLNRVLFPIEHRISGTTTLGQPASGYAYTPESSAFIIASHNTSGWNDSTSTNDGRTAAIVNYVKLENYGQGDHAYLAINGFVSGARAGASDFLANPAISMQVGTFTAGSDAVYLNGHEIDYQLGIFDAAAVGHVTNVTRNTGRTANGLGAVVGGYRAQSKGTYPLDWALSASGLMATLTDATTCDLGTNKAAHVIKGGDRIYLNGSSTNGRWATSLGSDYIQRTASGIEFYFGGSLAFRATTGGIGYVTGAGGAVTQATSRTTGVTINKACGQITLVSAAGSASWQTFTVTNSLVAATDVIRLNQASGTDKYMLHVTHVAAGSFDVTFATTGGTTTEQPVFNFALIKAAAS